jgi:predicted Fe-Mo cluster-binding NifX family protein
MSYKIAAVTEDGRNLSSHFGMAPEYRVFSIDNGQVLSEERRPKPHHGQHPEGQHHGHSHDDMFAPVDDCLVLLCGGMGTPAYQKALETGLEVVLTGGEIGNAVQSYLSGQAKSDLRRVHQN